MWTYPRILAHRGGGVLAPENTMAALRKGYEMGFRGVEFDVMATRDDGLILMHDDYLGRTVAGAGSATSDQCIGMPMYLIIQVIMSVHCLLNHDLHFVKSRLASLFW